MIHDHICPCVVASQSHGILSHFPWVLKFMNHVTDSSTKPSQFQVESQLWTHQRELIRESLVQLSPEKWRELKVEVCEQLEGSRD